MWTQHRIESPWGVTAFGSALIDALPDLAVVKFTVAHVTNKPSDAFDETHAAADRVRQVLAEAGIGEGAVSTSRVELGIAERFHAGERKFVGYRAQIRYRVRTAGLDDVELLVARLVEAGVYTIESMDFHSSRIRELREEARAAAVVAARRKAESYVQAAGARLGPVLHIEDVDPDTLKNPMGHGPSLDLEAHTTDATNALRTGSITVAAAVMVGFAIHVI